LITDKQSNEQDIKNSKYKLQASRIPSNGKSKIGKRAVTGRGTTSRSQKMAIKITTYAVLYFCERKKVVFRGSFGLSAEGQRFVAFISEKPSNCLTVAGLELPSSSTIISSDFNGRGIRTRGTRMAAKNLQLFLSPILCYSFVLVS
jgi:hypothetical protein